VFSRSQGKSTLHSQSHQSFCNAEQLALQESVKKLVEEVINPNTDTWETEKMFPAQKVLVNPPAQG
jgi:hypothetical protein